jgi:hypothetical protein
MNGYMNSPEDGVPEGDVPEQEEEPMISGEGEDVIFATADE